MAFAVRGGIKNRTYVPDEEYGQHCNSTDSIVILFGSAEVFFFLFFRFFLGRQIRAARRKPPLGRVVCLRQGWGGSITQAPPFVCEIGVSSTAVHGNYAG